MHMDGRRRCDGIHERESAGEDERGADLGASSLAVLSSATVTFQLHARLGLPTASPGEKSIWIRICGGSIRARTYIPVPVDIAHRPRTRLSPPPNDDLYRK